MTTLKTFLTSCLFITVLASGTTPAFSQVSISIGIAPPPLQVYSQPPCPDDGYIWTPGYWAYGEDAYYWVPGTWVQPPQFGLLWTPPYWGWFGNGYRFHQGYWGSSVGYYGGINYGYGYSGNGYGGGRWQGQHFVYNTAVNNVNRNFVSNTYVDQSAVHAQGSRVSYNGGQGGLRAQPTAKQRQLAAQHNQPTSTQQTPSKNPQISSANNTGNFSNRPTPAVKQAPQEMPAPRTFETKSPADKPEKMQAQSFQTHPSSAAKPESHQAAQAKPQSHPAEHTQAKAPAQGNADHGDKPQGH